MAIGDAAVNAGMDVLNGLERANTLHTEVNKTRDYLAARTSTVLPVERGGTGATTPAAARAGLGVTDVATLPMVGVITNPTRSNAIGIRWEGGKAIIRVDATDVAWMSGDPTGAIGGVYDGRLSPAVHGRGTSGSWRSLAVQADGTLAHTASARRFKSNIVELEVTDAQLEQLRLVTFDWRDGGGADVGVVAEELAAAGLDRFTFHDDDGQLLGVHYERAWLAMLPVVQRLVQRVTELELFADQLRDGERDA